MTCCEQVVIEARRPARWADVSDSESDEEMVVEQRQCRGQSAIVNHLHEAIQRPRNDLDDDDEDARSSSRRSDCSSVRNLKIRSAGAGRGAGGGAGRGAPMPLRGNLESEALEPCKLTHDVVSTATESSTMSTSAESDVGQWENLLGRDLNVFATPFVPTFSQQCPVVGILVLAQDANTFAMPGSTTTQPPMPLGCSQYTTSPLSSIDTNTITTMTTHTAAVSAEAQKSSLCCGPPIQIPASAFPVSVPERSVSSVSSVSSNKSSTSSAQTASALQRRRVNKASTVAPSAPPPTAPQPASSEVADTSVPKQAGAAASAKSRKRRSKQASGVDREVGVMPEASEEVWQHRGAMRSKELAFFRERLDRYVAAQEECLNCRIDILPAPDPLDRTVSRRSWRKAMDSWLKANYMRIRPDEGHSSVISTEEWQSLAAESLATSCTTRCDDGDSECSV